MMSQRVMRICRGFHVVRNQNCFSKITPIMKHQLQQHSSQVYGEVSQASISISKQPLVLLWANCERVDVASPMESPQSLKETATSIQQTVTSARLQSIPTIMLYWILDTALVMQFPHMKDSGDHYLHCLHTYRKICQPSEQV